MTTTTAQLSTPRAAALYIGALLGPSLLLLPGLAASLAGPASILAWLGLLIVSGLLARSFAALGTLIPFGGVGAYATAGLGPWAGRATAWCFLAGVVCGAPIGCLIGGRYVAELLGGGQAVSVLTAAVLLAVVLALTLGGARATMSAQLVLVGALIVLVVVAVVGSAPAAHAANWTPFAPHGWASVGSAAAVLMLSSVGWEAIAPLTSQLRDPGRQLPRVIAIAFVVTAAVYLGLGVATVSVLGAHAGSAVPLADLLGAAVGSAGPLIAAVAAVTLTLAATNAYLVGATALLADLRSQRPGKRVAQSSRGLQIGIVATGFAALGSQAAGLVTTTQLLGAATALFLSVYLGCTAAATRVLTGGTRIAAGVACVGVLGALAFTGWALTVVLLIAVGALFERRAAVTVHHGGLPVPCPVG